MSVLANNIVNKLSFDTKGCWIWKGVKVRGYGRLYAAGKQRSLHRYMYELLLKRQIPPGYHLHHVCHRPACINPLHLEPLPSSEHRRKHNRVNLKSNIDYSRRQTMAAFKFNDTIVCPAGHRWGSFPGNIKNRRRYCKICQENF